MADRTHEPETIITDYNQLIQDNLDAVALGTEAIGQFSDYELQAVVRRHVTEHQESATRLQNAVRMMGGNTQSDGHNPDELRQSWQKVWADGDDNQKLLALRANERVAVDKYKTALTVDKGIKGLSFEGVAEYQKSLAVEVKHFEEYTDLLRGRGESVDNDEPMGAVRNALEHVHAAINLTGTVLDDVFKRLTGKNK